MINDLWYKNGIIYCLSVGTFMDANGDGVVDARIDVEDHPDRREEMMRLSGRRTVPQIWIGEQHVGGFDDLHALDRAADPSELLREASAPVGKAG